MRMYTREETKTLLREHNIPMEEFDKWINHQTVPEGGYYKYDVDRFITSSVRPGNSALIRGK